MRNLVLSMTLTAILFGFSSAFAADATMKADAQSVDTACAADAATANCGADKVGSGLLICLTAYKKQNPKYRFTPSCRAARKQMRKDRKTEK